MDVKATIPVMAHYIARRDELREAASKADAAHRPLTATRLRHAARLLQRAILSEQIDSQPPGIGRFDG